MQVGLVAKRIPWIVQWQRYILRSAIVHLDQPCVDANFITPALNATVKNRIDVNGFKLRTLSDPIELRLFRRQIEKRAQF